MSASPSAERGNESAGWPRRADVLRWIPAEHAIQAAIDAVEAAGADSRLTDAVILLTKARRSVADFVDGFEADVGLYRESDLRRFCAPGSDDALRRGCTCPVIQNTMGRGAFMDSNEAVYRVSKSCPLHGEKVAHV